MDKVLVSKVCGHVSESHLPLVNSWVPQNQREEEDDKNHKRKRTPINVELRCPPGRNISKILFATYGTPSGDCESYAHGRCHSPNSTSIVEQVRITTLSANQANACHKCNLILDPSALSVFGTLYCFFFPVLSTWNYLNSQV